MQGVVVWSYNVVLLQASRGGSMHTLSCNTQPLSQTEVLTAMDSIAASL